MDDRIEKLARRLFEAERRPDVVWGEVAGLREAQTMLALNEGERDSYRRRALSEFVRDAPAGELLDWPADVQPPAGWERVDCAVVRVDGVLQPIRIRKH